MGLDQRAAAERIRYQLRLIESIAQQAESGHFDLAAPGSELATDDALLGGHQTSHLVGHCLSVSQDALSTAKLILLDPITDGLRIPVVGQFPVLRTSIESASLAIWLLAPDEQRERLCRSLRARMDEIHHEDHLVTVLTEAEEGDTKAKTAEKQKHRRENTKRSRAQKKRLRDHATDSGIGLEDINRGLPGFGPIVRASSELVGISGNHTQGMWAFISGLTHPSVKRSIAASDIERLADGEVFAAKFTANLASVVMALDAAIAAHLTALRLLARRGGRPELAWSPGAEFPLPPGVALSPHKGGTLSD
ncbi:hypothetical protein [Microbacterium azadirachtae]|uniref:Uncharacterized protein n=1 Tax=Microbacterium azadirachtae TaxID=582680 RepID=A0A0F0LJP9_9MICO|nr:hypothetical protein [Microbacterium azadirachtae]KJL33432.1 hypothetical protein RS86_01653 [Microbacterium azadirachtae]